MKQNAVPREDEPVALHAHAMDNLRFIREAMEQSGSFTAVPGWGGVAMGATAVAAAAVAAVQPTPDRWVAVWLAEALVAFAVGFVAIRRKARRAGAPLLRGPARKFALGMMPPVAAGALLTAVLWQAGSTDLLPGVWMLLYGTAVVTGGAYSVRPVPAMGLCLMLLGALTLFVPPAWHNLALGLGFGGFHVAFGTVIARRYGG